MRRQSAGTFAPGKPAHTVTHSADCAEIPKIKAYRILLAFPGSNRRIAGDLRLTRLIGIGTHRFFSFVFYGYQKSLCDIIHRFGNGIGFLACLFSLEQGHHVSITTLNVYSGDTTQKISPSFSVYDFSFSIGFPSAR